MIREIGSILFLESNFNVWKSNKILIINFCSFLTPSLTSLYSSLINVVFSFLFTCSLNLEPLALYHHHHNKQNKYKIRWKRLFITTLESEIEKLNEMKQKNRLKEVLKFFYPSSWWWSSWRSCVAYEISETINFWMLF